MHHDHVRRCLADAHHGQRRSNIKRTARRTSRVRRERFAQLYVQTLDARQAAIRAGYKAEYGARILRDPDVQDRVQALLQQTARTVTKESVVHGLLREATFYGEGASATARVNAWKALGEVLGFSTQHVRHTHAIAWIRGLDVTQLDALEKLDDEQLVRALEQRELPAARDDLGDGAPVPMLPSAAKGGDAN